MNPAITTTAPTLVYSSFADFRARLYGTTDMDTINNMILRLTHQNRFSTSKIHRFSPDEAAHAWNSAQKRCRELFAHRNGYKLGDGTWRIACGLEVK